MERATIKVTVIKVVAPNGEEDVDIVGPCDITVRLCVAGEFYEGDYPDAPYWALAFGFTTYIGCETISVPVTKWTEKEGCDDAAG